MARWASSFIKPRHRRARWRASAARSSRAIRRVIIFVQVLVLVDTLAKAVELGGKRVMEPFDVPDGPTVAQMADPEGNIIGLVKQ